MEYSRPVTMETLEQHWNETLLQRKKTRSNIAVAKALEKYQETRLLLRTGGPMPSRLYKASQKRAFRFEQKWPVPLVAAAVACLLLGVGGYASRLLVPSISDKEDEPVAVRMATSIASAVLVGASVVIFQITRQRLTLRTHIEALHLLYVYDKMPTSGPTREVFDMKVGQKRGKVIQYNHYRVFSDGSIREDEENPVCC